MAARVASESPNARMLGGPGGFCGPGASEGSGGGAAGSAGLSVWAGGLSLRTLGLDWVSRPAGPPCRMLGMGLLSGGLRPVAVRLQHRGRRPEVHVRRVLQLAEHGPVLQGVPHELV